MAARRIDRGLHVARCKSMLPLRSNCKTTCLAHWLDEVISVCLRPAELPLQGSGHCDAMVAGSAPGNPADTGMVGTTSGNVPPGRNKKGNASGQHDGYRQKRRRNRPTNKWSRDIHFATLTSEGILIADPYSENPLCLNDQER